MEKSEDGNRFCKNCKKTVFDMSRMTEADADAFLDANPGSCGNFLSSQIDEAPAPEEKIGLFSRRTIRNSAWKKAAAAAAAVALLHGQMPAEAGMTDLKFDREQAATEAEGGDVKTRIGPSTNTLVTGVLIDQYDDGIAQPVVIKIFRGTELLVDSVTTDHGLFSVNLEGIALPSDRITIFIPAQNHLGTNFKEAKVDSILGECQNLVINVNASLPHRNGGVMMRPSGK